MKDIVGIILAAGEGTRMKSDLPKVLHKVCGKPILSYMLDSFELLGIKRAIVVVGYKAEQVKNNLKARAGVATVRQPKFLGSADAVRRTKRLFSKSKADVVIVYGDMPLIESQSLKRLIQFHRKYNLSCTILTAILKGPTGFGRVLRDRQNNILKIVEEQEANAYEKTIKEINVGAYCFKSHELFSALKEIKADNLKKEYYLTDIIEILLNKRKKVGSVCLKDEQQALGVNSRYDLSRASYIINKRNLERLIFTGVTIVDPLTTYIYGEVEIGRDTIIYPHTVIEGKVKIGKSCSIGPFAHLRSGCILKDRVEIGNFVEVVRSLVGFGSKIKHHSYIGDTTIGKKVNIGAGTIIANYDGNKKHPSFIADQAFIGTGTILIAPVKIGKKAITGAGSVVTKNKNVPSGVTVAGVPAKIMRK